MKLFIYDKFMDSFIRLPKGIQKKTMEFMDKFKKNPKSSAIHFEKINTFKDPQLRTARIDQTYRAIIHVSPKDDVFHLLWADHHDDAMSWAKNKIFEWNTNTQSYQVYDVEEKETEQTQTSSKPINSGTYKDYSDEQLEMIGVPKVLLPSVRNIYSLNELQEIENYLPSDAFEHLFYLSDGVSYDEIIHEIAEGKSILSHPKGIDVTTVNNQRYFFEITDKDIEAIFNDDFQKWRIFLHPSQRKIVNGHFNSSVKVTGLAGTGKTVCALHRAKVLSELEEVTSVKPILFTTFTKSLVDSLVDSLNLLGVPSAKIKVQNIHGLAIDLSKELGLIPSNSKILDFSDDDLKRHLWEEVLDFTPSRFDSDFLKAEFSDVVVQNNIHSEDEYLKVPRIGRSQKLGRKDRIEIWSVFKEYMLLKEKETYFEFGEILNKLNDHFKNKAKKPFSFIIADEIQDFSNPELRLLRSMVSEKENDLFLVGDPLQKIYSRKINFSKAGINVRGNRSKQLKVNYRTTEEIKRLAISSVSSLTYDNFDGEEERKNGYISLTHGEKPVYQLFSSENEEFSFLKNKIEELVSNEQSFSYKDICIATRLKSTMSDLKKYLHQSKIPYFDITSGTGNQNGLTLSTFHNTKGLEFKVVFLAGISNKTLPMHPSSFETWDRIQQIDFDTMERSLLYVAMTRAIQLLVLTGTGKKSDWIQI